MNLIPKRKLKWKEREFLTTASQLLFVIAIFSVLYFLSGGISDYSKEYQDAIKNIDPKINHKGQQIGLDEVHFNPYLVDQTDKNPKFVSHKFEYINDNNFIANIQISCSWYCNVFTIRGILSILNKENPAIIYKANAFLDYGAVVGTKSTQNRFLCSLGNQEYCQSKYIADSIGLLYAFAPIYSMDQKKLPMMYHHHQNFKHYLNSFGAKVVVIEGIYPSEHQKYKVTKPNNEPLEIQLLLKDNFYIRENLLNVAAKKVKEWEYLLWIDAHQMFMNGYWWEETIYKLEHFSTVQLFQDLVHLDPKYNTTVEHLHFPGSVYVYSHTRPIQAHIDRYHIWIGNAWGIRRELYEKIGSILDICISGCCDCAYNIAALKNVSDWNILDTWPHYRDTMMPWIKKAASVFEGKSSVVRGRINHLWHERFFNYEKMMKAMAHGNYNPDTDIQKDVNGTIELVSPYLKKLFSEG